MVLQQATVPLVQVLAGYDLAVDPATAGQSHEAFGMDGR
jgi:hypothetical protein